MVAIGDKPSVLITGCSEGGIGYALAKEFQSRGIYVIATARNLSKMTSLKNLPNVVLLSLDVTSPSMIATAVQTVQGQTNGTLTYLVNNSGSQYLSPILDVNINLAKEMYEVNVWGVVAMIKAFSPLLIKGKGTFVNIASIAGLLYPPWMGKSTHFFLSKSPLYRSILTGKGLYSGSKSCMATISETLRLEMKPLGVNVVTVITGAIETNLFANAPEQQSLPEDSLYKPAEEEIMLRTTGGDVKYRSKGDDFARDLVKVVLRGC